MTQIGSAPNDIIDFIQFKNHEICPLNETVPQVK